MKKVSVIIPFYNASEYIDPCMRSLINQTIGFENIEVIAVDDCSKDDTLQKLSDYEEKYPESVKVVPLDTNVMQGAARNAALPHATGEYLDFVDADDYMHPTAYEKLYRIARQNSLDMLEYLYTPVKDHKAFLSETRTGQKDRITDISSIQARRQFILESSFLRGCWNKFYDLEFVKQNRLRYAEGVYDEESLFSGMAAITCRRYGFHPEILYYYFQNPGGTCYDRSMDINRRYDNAKVWYELIMELDDRGLLKDIHNEFAVIFIANYLLRTIAFSCARQLPLEFDAINTMQATINAYFPDINDNPYIKADPVWKNFSKWIGVGISPDNVRDFIKDASAIPNIF